MKFIIAIILLFALAVLVLILRPSGPRVTHIEHRRDEADEREDGE